MLDKAAFEESRVAVKSVKGQKKKVTITWKKVEGAEGYVLKLVDNLVVVNKVVKEVSLLHNYYMLRVAHEVSQYTTELKNHTGEYIVSC